MDGVVQPPSLRAGGLSQAWERGRLVSQRMPDWISEKQFPEAASPVAGPRGTAKTSQLLCAAEREHRWQGPSVTPPCCPGLRGLGTQVTETPPCAEHGQGPLRRPCTGLAFQAGVAPYSCWDQFSDAVPGRVRATRGDPPCLLRELGQGGARAEPLEGPSLAFSFHLKG